MPDNTNQLPAPVVEGELLFRAIVRGDGQALSDLLAPLAGWRNDPLAGLAFIEAGSAYHERLLGVQLLAQRFRGNGDYISAVALARALFRALEYDPAVMDERLPNVRIMAGNVLDTLSAMLTELGDASEVYLESARWIRFIERSGLEPERVTQIRLKQLEALLQAGHYEDALAIAEEIRKQTLPRHLGFEFERLDRKVRQLCRPVSAVAAAEARPQQVAQSALEALASILPGGLDLQGIQAALAGTAATASSTMGFDPSALVAALGGTHALGWTAAPKDIDDLERRVRELPSARHPYAAFASVVQGAGRLIQDPAAKDRSVLDRLDAAVGAALPYARARGFWEDAATLAWTRCIARKRAGHLLEAAQALRLFRDDIDARRLLVSDPRLRAGLPAQFRYLYEVSAEVLAILGESHAAELFHVIEGAKSKILGELTGATPLTSRDAHAGPDFFRWLEARTLADLRTLLALSPTRAAYLTLFCDDASTYAVLVPMQIG